MNTSFYLRRECLTVVMYILDILHCFMRMYVLADFRLKTYIRVVHIKESTLLMHNSISEYVEVELSGRWLWGKPTILIVFHFLTM